MLGMFLASLGQTIVATAICPVANDLDGLSLQAWATTAYPVTSTVSTPLYGKLSDIFGRRPLYLVAIAVFLGGSDGFSQAVDAVMLTAGVLVFVAFLVTFALPNVRLRDPQLAARDAAAGQGAAAGQSVSGSAAG
jgi:MFS family permease